jgi:transposase InsO family protein
LKPSNPKETPVKLHGNAKLTPVQRCLLATRVLEEHWTVTEAAEAAGVSDRTAYRLLRRWRDGDHELFDRSSAPRRVPRRTSVKLERAIEVLRRLRMTSTAIAAKLHMPVSTVCAVLQRLGLNRLWKLGPAEPPNRYCRRHAGELVHVDVKKLGRFDRPGHRVRGRGPGRRTQGAGWEAVHVCVDDATRLAYVEVLPDERAVTTIGFFERAVAWFALRGITVRQVLSDNGSPYRSRPWATWCAAHHIEHLRTRPYRPRTNGKAERFIQTMLREWAYPVSYRTSEHRARALPAWIDYYNYQRPHGALGHKTPASRLTAA